MELQPKEISKLQTYAVDYYGIAIRFFKLPDNNILLNTNDVCQVLGITNRAYDEDLSISGLDLVSAVSIASKYNINFTQWLNRTFSTYKQENTLRAEYEDRWMPEPF
jgi:prophage antirepressor-like protein